MGYAQSPLPPPHHPSRNTMPMLYYGLVVLATAGLVMAMYNLIIIKWCSGHQRSLGPRRLAQLIDVVVVGDPGNFGKSIRGSSFLSSFKYEKGVSKGEHDVEVECAVCLSVFEEGEEVRQLPLCMHCFHAGCIDMWLCSHSDCQLCRSPVHAPPSSSSQLRSMPENDSEHSREGLLVPAAALVVPNP